MIQFPQDKIRNIAIIAHVDHGKTTLVDAFIKQSHLFRDNQEEMQQTQILDSNELEREKGITILAKNIAVVYKGYKVNIIDTPGHADFGGEVERTLNMADGCVLVVDAQEGTMPQTEFVLKKALELGLRPIVLINKIDKKFADPKRVENEIYDLFLNLAVDDSQLDFPIFYAIGREGKVFENLPDGDLTVPNTTIGDIRPLLDKVIEYIPAPKGDPEGKFQMQICSLDFDPHTGRYLIGKVIRGKANVDQSMVVVQPVAEKFTGESTKDNTETNNAVKKIEKLTTGRIRKILVREGLNYIETDVASTGDIVALAGLDTTAIGATVCDYSAPEPLEPIRISPPSVKIKIEPNTSPLAGKEGDFVTAKQLEQRIEKEKSLNIGLVIDKADGGSYYISGRGELQLSVLIETMRREGYEFQVRRPEVIIIEKEGVKCEPIEKLYIDVPEEFLGVITNALSSRKAEMVNMITENGNVRFIYKILTRNLLGLRNQLLTATKGTAVLNNFLIDYVKYENTDDIKRNGVLVATEAGTSMGYSLNTAQERGDLFIGPGLDVYEGMIIGISKYEYDIDISVTKARHQSAVRMKHDEITQTSLKPVIPLTLEYALVFLAKDEILEVTPKNLRLRKLYLTRVQREWAKRKNLTVFAQNEMAKIK